MPERDIFIRYYIMFYFSNFLKRGLPHKRKNGSKTTDPGVSKTDTPGTVALQLKKKSKVNSFIKKILKIVKKSSKDDL